MRPESSRAHQESGFRRNWRVYWEWWWNKEETRKVKSTPLLNTPLRCKGYCWGSTVTGSSELDILGEREMPKSFLILWKQFYFCGSRSEERRVGKECRWRRAAQHAK